MRQMVAKYNGRCRGCGEAIRKGEFILWSKQLGSYHASNGCQDAAHGDDFGRHEAAQEARAFEAGMDWELAQARRDDAEYRRGQADVAAIQAVSEAGSALREALYLEMEAQWEREGVY